MKAAQIYNRAEENGISFEASCSSVTMREWNRFMEGTTKANGRKIRQIIKKHLPSLYEDLSLQFHNPYENQSVKKEGLLVYVHSGIEYFLTIN